MNTANFWASLIADPQEIIETLDCIKTFNEKVMNKLSCLFKLSTEPEFISRKELVALIKAYKLPSKDMYDSKGKLIPMDYYDKIIFNTNVQSIVEPTPIRYGITLKKISIRSFPSKGAIYSNINDSKIDNFDRFQETGCFPFEPVLILHESYDKQWFFIKTYNYIGWAKTSEIAVSYNKSEIFHYNSCENFIMIIGKEVTLTLEENNSRATMKVGMGSRICLLASYSLNSDKKLTVKIPARNNDGKLVFKKAYIDKNHDISIGYLPYTRYNILNQALKYLNTTYDWGDKYNGKDCSSFILTIFRCFGFLLPRNAGQQEHSIIHNTNSIVFNETDTIASRLAKINKLMPGAALFMKGHGMLYLGKHKDTHYMIHSFLGYGVKKDSAYEAKTATRVAISPIDILTSGGTPFFEKFTSAIYFQ
jgi:hypothetical protein